MFTVGQHVKVLTGKFEHVTRLIAQVGEAVEENCEETFTTAYYEIVFDESQPGTYSLVRGAIGYVDDELELLK